MAKSPMSWRDEEKQRADQASSLMTPGGKGASARRVFAYRGLGLAMVVLGFVIGVPGRDQSIAIALACLGLAELATAARALEELAMQGQRVERSREDGL